jgi:hypothetical protein
MPTQNKESTVPKIMSFKIFLFSKPIVTKFLLSKYFTIIQLAMRTGIIEIMSCPNLETLRKSCLSMNVIYGATNNEIVNTKMPRNKSDFQIACFLSVIFARLV